MGSVKTQPNFSLRFCVGHRNHNVVHDAKGLEQKWLSVSEKCSGFKHSEH